MLWLKVSFPDLVDGFAFFFVQRRRCVGFYIVGLKPLPCFGVLVCCSCCFHWRGSWGGNETLPSDWWRKRFISNVIWLLPSRNATVVGVWVFFCLLNVEYAVFRIILHHGFTIRLFLEHESPSIAIILWFSALVLNTSCHLIVVNSWSLHGNSC